jgi:putative hydrolase of the HAD superfamily
MEKDFLKFMKRCLRDLKPLEPLPTGMSDRLFSLAQTRAVLFDIYGTLLVSASGDVESTEFTEASIVSSMRDAAVALKDPHTVGRETIDIFRGQIAARHSSLKEKGMPYPEVDIVEVWEAVIRLLEERGLVRSSPETDYRRLALRFEVSNNPVYPMPDMKAALEGLRRRGVVLGIISNAQFITPILMNYFLSGRVSEDQRVPPFSSDLTLFSFEWGRAKPDPWLFAEAKRRLAAMNIAPEQAVYVGNDMLKDIAPARNAGFKALLFAGDRRSLRLREKELGDIQPHGIVTGLSRIPEWAACEST